MESAPNTTVKPVDGVLPEPTKGEILEALLRSVVTQGGTKTKHGATIATDCVKPGPNAAARNGHVSDDEPLETKVDLDGDGQNDQLWVDAAGMTLTYEMYVMRGACGHHVGRVQVSGPLEATNELKNGMHVLRSKGACPVDCCPEQKTFEVVYDGRVYKARSSVKKRDC